MATRRLQYSQELEKQLAKGKKLEDAHNIAAKKSETTRKVVKAKKTEEGLMSRTGKRLAKVFGGKKIVKPTASEKKVVQKRLKKKYPQMAQAEWGRPKRKKK